MSVAQGSSGTTTISLTNTGGFSSSVALTASGLPTGVTAAFNPTSISGTATSILTLTAASTAATGTATVTITGTSGSLIRTAPVSMTVTANPILTSITVSPSSAALQLNGTQPFTAVAKDQNGTALATQPTFTWSVVSGGVGTVSSAGNYSAGATAGSATVKATSGSVSGTAAVTVTNAAPTVATAAAANPSTVIGTTTALSVLGADDGGEANLIYTWATTGTPPAAVTFSVNGTNAAKNATATFTKAGSYSFQVTIKDAGGLTAASSVTVTVNATFTSVVISPPTATVNLNGTQSFAATAQDQFGTALTTQPTVSWTAAGGGSISPSTGASATYTAPATVPSGSVTVTATSGSIHGTATVTVQSNTATSLRVDAGSSAAYTDVSTNVWSADNYFTGGTVEAPATPPTIAGTSDPKLYQTQRVGTSFSYALPIPNGKYILGLSFAEIDGSTTGQRVFNVSANGTTVLTGFDIYTAAGGANKAVGRSFPVTITNGQLALTFTATTGQAAVSAISLLSPTPALDIPAPGWAEDVLPTDDASDADGMGPAAASGVNLASGVEENSPGPDLWAFNPLGPSASYERRYRSARAQKGYASPGLSPGWTDGYDLVVTPAASGYTLTYDNGGQDHWTGTTGSLGTPAGAPYLVTASGTAITMTFKDRSKYVFTQISTAGGNYPANAYLLTRIVNLVGHAITLNRAAANGYRVMSITNDAPATLLSFAYNGDGTLQSVTDPVGGRQITYGFSGGSLSTVSQIAATGTASPPTRWQYGYTSVMSASLLNSVSAPDPSNPGSLVAAVTAYDPLTGTVSQHKDASGRVHCYGYMGSQTLVQVNNSDGSLAESWTQKQNTGGGMNADGGTTDAAGKADSVMYGGMSSPYLPAAATNRNSQTSQVAYNDNYGNVLSTTSPRGVVSTFAYANPSDFPLNQVASVTESTTQGDTKQPTSFTYYGPSDGVINGLLHTVSSPQPDTLASSPGTPVTTTYAYDSLGNVTQTTGPNANGTMTVTYNYTQDGAFTQAEALGEPLVVTVSGPDAYGATTTTITHSRYDQRGNRISVVDALGNETDFAYNLADQLTDTLYPATGDSGTVNPNVPNSGRAKTTTAYLYPGGPAAGTTVYDESGASFRQVSNIYDAEGELLTVSGDTYPVTYAYDGRGRVKSVTYYQQSIMNGSTTYYDYDAVGNLADIRYPGQTGANFDEMQYGYDADNNLIKEIDGIGLEKDYLRADPESLMTGIHYVYPAGYAGTKIGDVAYTYDHYGRRSSTIDHPYYSPIAGTSSPITYTYDDLDEITSQTTTYNFDDNYSQSSIYQAQMTLSHNPDGSRSYRSMPDYGADQSYYYDGVGRMILSYSPGAGGGSKYTYFSNGWLAQRQSLYYSSTYNQYVPFLQVDKTYNQRGLLKTLTNSLVADPTKPTQLGPLAAYSGMTYDPDGNRLGETAVVPHPSGSSAPNMSRTVLYGYDRLDELAQETSQATAGTTGLNYAATFAYDLSGNPTSSTASGPGYSQSGSGGFNTGSRFSGLSFNADNQNQSTVQPNNASKSIPYNGNGDPLSLSLFNSVHTPLYDPEDRLTTLDSSSQVAIYNADGLCVFQRYGYNSGDPACYLYDGDTRIVTDGGDGNGYGTYDQYGADGLEARFVTAGSNGYSYGAYAYDPQGNLVAPVGLTASGSQVVPMAQTLFAYDAFGRDMADVNGDSLTYENGFGGQYGYRKDAETGYYLLGHRYYDAHAGRFVTRDPIGYKGGINLYGFTGNNPVNESDPSGFRPIIRSNSPYSLGKGLGIDWAKVGAAIGRGFKEVLEAQELQGLNPPPMETPVDVGASPDARAEQEMEQETERLNRPVTIGLPKGGTYILRDPVNGKVMRTGMAANLGKRKSDHKKSYPDLVFEIDRRSSSRDARRGREQIIHDLHNPPLDVQNPIKRKNYTEEQYQRMMDAGRKL